MAPRQHTCSMPRCRKPSDRDMGGCRKCKIFLCFMHSRSHRLECGPNPEAALSYESAVEAELERLRLMINDAAVCEYASGLNGGRKCHVEHETRIERALIGHVNYHARIRFNDGSPSWLIRVPRVARFVLTPSSTRDYLMRSEYATLKFLETTAVPAPRAFGYGLRSDGSDKGVGVSFILMEELPGKPWHMAGPPDSSVATVAKQKFWSSVADIPAELAKHPFPKAGSLTIGSNGLVEMGPVASERFVILDPYGRPFESAADYYSAWAEQHMALIADGQLYGAYPVEAYLVHSFLKDNVWQLVQEVDDDGGDDNGEGQGPEQFFLKHVDDPGHHLLVDDNYNITGIIDWQMARVVPPREAFGPSLVTADMQALCRNKQGLSGTRDLALADALGELKGDSPELTRWWRDEKARRFFWGMAMEPAWSDALDAAKGILEAFGVHQDWDDWRETALKEYSKTDRRLRRLKAIVKARSVRQSPYNLRSLGTEAPTSNHAKTQTPSENVPA